MQQNRNERLARFARGPMYLKEALRSCPRRMWMFHPSERRWSVHEILFHLADSEAAGYIRCRQLIAEPGTEIVPHRASRWAKALGYFYQSPREALEMISLLRAMTHYLLRHVSESVWQHTARHPSKGTLTLDRWLNLQNEHLEHHLAQIRENQVQWSLQRSGKRKLANPLLESGHGGVLAKVESRRLTSERQG